jgi:hypothetical protein
MIRKSGGRFSEKIMLHQNVRAPIDSIFKGLRSKCARSRRSGHLSAAGNKVLTTISQTALGSDRGGGAMSAALHRIEHLSYYLFVAVVLITNITTVFHDSLHLF